MLEIRSTPEATGALHIAVAGDIDLGTASQLESVLIDAIAVASGRIAIDLAGVGFIDSTGVAVLIKAARAAERGNITLAVQGVRGMVARVLQMTGVAAYLGVPEQP